MRAFDSAIRVAGACVAATLAAMTALLEAFATPYLWIIPVGAALLANLLLYLFARVTIARSWAWIVPAVPWFAVMMLAVASTSEGDQIANSWTGLATFGAGAIGFFVPAAIAAPIKPQPEPPVKPEPQPSEPSSGAQSSGPQPSGPRSGPPSESQGFVDGHGEEGAGERPEAR